jgi:hypothetical protein
MECADGTAESPSHKALLIDLENCPSQIKQLLSDIRAFSQVVICYANGSPKIPLDWLIPLAGAVSGETLRIVKMENGGKNAADFGICFFAGMLMQSLPPDTHFVIVSNDTDLDHAVSLLASQGRTAERVGRTSEPGGENGAVVNGNDAADPLSSYCAYLAAHPNTRPAKETTLRNSIKARFGGAETMVEMVFRSLMDSATLKIEGGRIVYSETTLQALAAKFDG